MKDPRFSKFVVFVNSLVPLAILTWDGFQHHLGADPAMFAIHTTGMIALIFLTLSLTITPLRKYTGWNWLSHFRRTLGNFAFFYACVHLSIYTIFEQAGIARTAGEILHHRYLMIGFLSLLVMLPLAITSTNGMIKRLGSANWKRLHKLAYVAAVGGVTHFWMSKKADINLPLTFAIVLGILFAYRLLNDRFDFLRAKPAAIRRVSSSPAAS